MSANTRGRLTAEDRAIEDAAFATVTGRPRTQHLLPPPPASPTRRVPNELQPGGHGAGGAESSHDARSYGANLIIDTRPLVMACSWQRLGPAPWC